MKMFITSYVIPVIIVFLITLSIFKKNNTFDSFAMGAKDGLHLAISVFPFLATVFVMVSLFRASGLATAFSKLLEPLMTFLGIPSELCELILIRPFSGSGSLALLEDIYLKYGADSYIARCASVIIGSSETVFYISAVYFSKSNIKNLRYGIPLALIVTLLGEVFSCFLCRFM